MSRILLVNDQEKDLASYVRAAKAVGFREEEIVQVRSEADAEEKLDTPFAVAVVDICLRGRDDEDGVRLVGTIKHRQPDCPVLAVTATAPSAAGIRALRAGACDFIRADEDPKFISWMALLQRRILMWKEYGETPAKEYV